MARRGGDTGEGGDVGTVTVDTSYGYAVDAPRQDTATGTETAIASAPRAEAAAPATSVAAEAPAAAPPEVRRPVAKPASQEPATSRASASAPARPATLPAAATSRPVTQQTTPARQVLQAPVAESMGRPGGQLASVAKAGESQAPAGGARRGKVAKVGG